MLLFIPFFFFLMKNSAAVCRSKEKQPSLSVWYTYTAGITVGYVGKKTNGENQSNC